MLILSHLKAFEVGDDRSKLNGSFARKARGILEPYPTLRVSGSYEVNHRGDRGCADSCVYDMRRSLGRRHAKNKKRRQDAGASGQTQYYSLDMVPKITDLSSEIRRRVSVDVSEGNLGPESGSAEALSDSSRPTESRPSGAVAPAGDLPIRFGGLGRDRGEKHARPGAGRLGWQRLTEGMRRRQRRFCPEAARHTVSH